LRDALDPGTKAPVRLKLPVMIRRSGCAKWGINGEK
jgi:hypothetical protein